MEGMDAEESMIVERAFGRVLASVASGSSLTDAFRFECSSRGALHPSLARFARAFRLHDQVHRPLPFPKLSSVPIFEIACVVGPSHKDVIKAIKAHTTEGINLPPTVLFRFPQEAALPAENFAQFCLPTQATLETLDEHEDALFPPESVESRLFGHRRSLHRGLSSHVFILTGSDTDSSCELRSLASGQQANEVAAALSRQVEGRVRYCVCISLLEPYLPLIHCDAAGKVDVGYHHEGDASSHPFVVERVFCVVSRFPLFSLLFKIARSFAANWRLSAFTTINLAVKNLRDKAAAEALEKLNAPLHTSEIVTATSIASSPPPPPPPPSTPIRSLFGWRKTESPKIPPSVDQPTNSSPQLGETTMSTKKKKRTYMSRVVGSYWKKKHSPENSNTEDDVNELPLTPEIEEAAIRTLEESMTINCSSSIPLLSTLYKGKVPEEGASLIVPSEINQQLGNSRTQYIRIKSPSLKDVVESASSNTFILLPDLAQTGEFPHMPFTLSQHVIDALDNPNKKRSSTSLESHDCGVSLESDEARLQIALWTAPIFFSLLPLDSILLLIGAALTERKIIFVAQKLPLECVSACALCMIALIRPLTWAGPLLPTLPDALIELLMSPVPLITGVTYLPEGFELDESTIVVDLDDASLKFPESNDDDTYLGIRLPLYNDLYYKLLPHTAKIHIVDGDAAPKVVFVPTDDQSKSCLRVVEAINSYVRTIVHYTVSHGVASASPLRQRFLPTLSSIKTQILRNCRPSEVLFFKRFLSSQLLSGFLEASSRRLLACEPLLQQPTDDPADEVEIEADKKSIRLWTEKGGKLDRSEDFSSVRELANGGLKRTLRAHKLGDEIVDSNTPSLAQVKNDDKCHEDDNNDNDGDDDEEEEEDVVSDVDQVIENTDKAVLSKSYSQPFQLVAIIKKMRLKK